MEKKNDNSFILGFATGFLTFFAADYLRDAKKRKELVADIKQLEKEAKPYLKEFKSHLIASSELKTAVKTIDSILGSDFEGYVKNLESQEKNTPKEDGKKTTSIRKFFKFKK